MENTKTILEILAAEAVLGVGCLLLVAACGFVLARKVVLRLVTQAAGRTKTSWDDALVERGVVSQGSYLVPAVVVYFGLVTPYIKIPPIYFQTTTLKVGLKYTRMVPFY